MRAMLSVKRHFHRNNIAVLYGKETILNEDKLDDNDEAINILHLNTYNLKILI